MLSFPNFPPPPHIRFKYCPLHSLHLICHLTIFNIPFLFAVALALSSSLSLLPCPLLLPTQFLLPLPSPLPPQYQSRSFCHHCMLLLLVNVSWPLPTGIPWMQQARTISFFMMVTRLPCITHKLVSLKTSTMKYSAASWRARRAVLCICRSLFLDICPIISRTRC